MKNNIIKEQTLVLEGLYNHFNAMLFDNELPSVALTIQSQGRKSCYGWCTLHEAWICEKENLKNQWHEINLSAEHMARGVHEVSATLIHEMVHLWNSVNGINDCNTKTQNHNVKFKDMAEKVGLVVEKVERKGWSRTSLSERLVLMIDDYNAPDVFNACRVNPPKPETERKKKEQNIYTCNCGVEIKTSKELDIICGKCESKFEKMN